MKIGIVGCGNISGIYFKNLTELFDNIEVYACADLDESKVKAAAEKYHIPHIMTLEEMLLSPEIECILNITTPMGHYPITKKALLAGKHVYLEKPLSLSYKEGKELVAIAEEKGLYLGCAPDTFLGAGIETCRALIGEGAIGRPIGGAAYMMGHGHESWHPDPAFYYDFGGGPLFDMGPYYLTALVRLLGRAESVMAYASRAYEERVITSKPRCGEVIPVKVDTHHAGIVRFANGALITVCMSFDVWKHEMPRIELYGTDGSLSVPDPNCFGGPVCLATSEKREYTEQSLLSPYFDNSRGIGLSEMALAVKEKRPANASGKLALHVLEIMEAFCVSAKEGRMIMLESDPGEAVALDWTAEKGRLKTK